MAMLKLGCCFLWRFLLPVINLHFFEIVQQVLCWCLFSFCFSLFSGHTWGVFSNSELRQWNEISDICHSRSLPPSCLPIASLFSFSFCNARGFHPIQRPPPILPPTPSFSSNYTGECIWSWISFSPSFFGPLWLLVWGCLNVPIWAELSPFINFSHVHFYFVSEEIKWCVMEMKCPALNMISCWLLQASRNCPTLCFWSPIVVDRLHTNLNKWNLIKKKKGHNCLPTPSLKAEWITLNRLQ